MPDHALPTAPALDDLAAFLVQEAALLDGWQLDRWLALYAPDAIYWIPIEPGQQSGYETVSHIHDDRRLLETRVRRFNHAMFHAQKPPSRTVRFVSNVRLAPDPLPGCVAVLSSYEVAEFRNNRHRRFVGTCRHDLAPGGAPWLIKRKRFELIDSEAEQDGISIIL